MKAIISSVAALLLFLNAVLAQSPLPLSVFVRHIIWLFHHNYSAHVNKHFTLLQ
jgi:hypothetical protein